MNLFLFFFDDLKRDTLEFELPREALINIKWKNDDV